MRSANSDNRNIVAERLRGLDKGWWISWAIHLALLVSMFAWFCSALGLMTSIYAAVPGVAALLLFPLFQESKKLFAAVTGAVSTLTAALAYKRIIEGFKLLANRLFSISEASQSYRYDRFEINVNDAESAACILIALAFISLIYALVSALLLCKNGKIIPAVAFAAVTSFTSYFGISAAFVWMVIPAALCLVSLIPHEIGIRRYFAAALTIAAIFAASLAFFPNEVASVSELDESLRDRLALQTARYDGETATQHLAPPPDAEPEEQKDTNGEQSAYNIPTADILLIVAVVIIILLILFVPAIINDRLRKRANAERAAFEDADNSVSICAMFLYAMRWIKAYGIAPENKNYSAWAYYLEEHMPKEYMDSYKKTVLIWYEAAFSGHEMTENQRNEVFEFLKYTGSEIWNRTNKRKHLFIKYRCGLVMEGQQ